MTNVDEMPKPVRHDNQFHTSVLLKEAVDYLRIEKGKWYIDATLGGGGHTFAIAQAGGLVLGIDADQDAIDHVTKQMTIDNLPVTIEKETVLERGNFRNIREIAEKHDMTRVAGVLFDLGVSSHQVDTGVRGFSFQNNGPLDMRMDAAVDSVQGVRARDLLHALGKDELMQLFREYGEERNARKIAEAIITRRTNKTIETTDELVQIIEYAQGRRGGARSPKDRAILNTKVFQALRIAVNDELGSLEIALPQAIELLETGKRLVVISFHSLEDRIVKRAFLKFAADGLGTILTKKPVVPTEEEQKENPRSRSAKLRVFEKNPHPPAAVGTLSQRERGKRQE